MSTEGWKKVWESRTWKDEITSLDALIRLDGFDSGAGQITAASWQRYADIIAANLGLRAGDSVYEVGCGAGAFLFALKTSGALSGELGAVAGLDYSLPLVEAARAVMPGCQFHCAEAICLDPSIQFDFVISNSVFQYFPIDYAFEVLEKMCRKAVKGVALLELPDLQKRDESEAFRSGVLERGEYNRKYAGLSHTYYDRSWISALASTLGMECNFSQQCIPNYAQNSFRFNVILRPSESPPNAGDALN